MISVGNHEILFITNHDRNALVSGLPGFKAGTAGLQLLTVGAYWAYWFIGVTSHFSESLKQLN